MPARGVAKSVPAEIERALDDASKAFAKAEAATDQRRRELHAAAVAAVHAGMSKSEVARRTRYTREYVAKLVTTAAQQP